MTIMPIFNRSTPRSLRPAALVVAIVMTVLLTAGVFAESDPPTASKPTVVLVHGAWADASSWNKVAERLVDTGYPVIAPANPLRGVASDSAYLASVLATIAGPIVLVGHSYGGMVITNAAAGNTNVKALVYIAAYIPDVTDTALGLTGRFPGSHIVPPGSPGANLTPRPFPLSDGTTGLDLYINAENFRDIFAGDVAAEKTAVMAVTQRPWAFSALFEKSQAAAWKRIPSWALVATEDHAIGAANERAMATNAKAHIVEVDSSHVAMISHPGQVTDLIVTAAHSIQ